MMTLLDKLAQPHSSISHLESREKGMTLPIYKIIQSMWQRNEIIREATAE